MRDNHQLLHDPALQIIMVEFHVQVRLDGGLTVGTHIMLAVVDTELLALGDMFNAGGLLKVEMGTSCPYSGDGRHGGRRPKSA